MQHCRPIMVIILTIFMIGLAGCSENSAEKKPSDSAGQKPPAPTEITAIADDLDLIISQLDEKTKQVSTLPMQKDIQLNPTDKKPEQDSEKNQTPVKQQQSQNEQPQGETTSNQESSSKQSDNAQTQQQKGAAQSAPSNGDAAGRDWQVEFSTLRNIHTRWNSVLPEAVEAGMTLEVRNEFTAALNQLTQEMSKQQPEQSLAAALILYKNYADLVYFFSSSTPSEFYQVKYQVMTSIFEGNRNNWVEAEEHVPQMKERWLYLGAQAKDVDSKILSKTEFSLMDLEQAIKLRQRDLTIIKGEIAMMNLKTLAKKLHNQSPASGQEQNSDNPGQ